MAGQERSSIVVPSEIYYSISDLISTADADAYRNNYCWADFFSPAAIEEISVDEGSDRPQVYYILMGLRVNPTGLIPGIYIVARSRE